MKDDGSWVPATVEGLRQRRQRLVRAYIDAMFADNIGRVTAIRKAYWRLVEQIRTEQRGSKS